MDKVSGDLGRGRGVVPQGDLGQELPAGFFFSRNGKDWRKGGLGKASGEIMGRGAL